MNTLDDLIFTLSICRKCLPGDAHPVHFERLQEIERIVRERADQNQRIAELTHQVEYWRLETARARAKQAQKGH